MNITKINTILKYKNNLKFIVSIFAITFIFSTSSALAATKVAITMIVDHPSLNSNRKGIEDTLAGHNVEIIYQSAQSQISTATQIATKFISNNADILVSISTPSTQSMIAARKNRNTPIVFSAITDPVSARIVKSLEGQGNNITGAIDTPPLQELLIALNQLTSAKTVGIIFNASEANSVKVVENIENLAKNIKIIKSTVTSTIEVKQAAMKLVGKVDAIIIPSDNTVFAAIDSLIKVTNQAKIPVFSSDSDSVKKGVLLSLGYNQYEVGKEAGRKILQIINGKNAGEINITTPNKYEIVLNDKAYKLLGIKVNKETLGNIRVIEG